MAVPLPSMILREVAMAPWYHSYGLAPVTRLRSAWPERKPSADRYPARRQRPVPEDVQRSPALMSNLLEGSIHLIAAGTEHSISLCIGQKVMYVLEGTLAERMDASRLPAARFQRN